MYVGLAHIFQKIGETFLLYIQARLSSLLVFRENMSCVLRDDLCKVAYDFMASQKHCRLTVLITNNTILFEANKNFSSTCETFCANRIKLIVVGIKDSLCSCNIFGVPFIRRGEIFEMWMLDHISGGLISSFWVYCHY